MAYNDPWGLGIDVKTWNALLAAGPPSLTHELWCAAIRAVAGAILADARAGEASGPELEDDAPDELVESWQEESMPSSATIAEVLGDDLRLYLSDLGVSWDEKVSLVGEACGSALDIADDLHGRLEGLPDAQDAITEETVEDFYAEWRTRFLERVLRETSALRTRERP